MLPRWTATGTPGRYQPRLLLMLVRTPVCLSVCVRVAVAVAAKLCVCVCVASVAVAAQLICVSLSVYQPPLLLLMLYGTGCSLLRAIITCGQQS